MTRRDDELDRYLSGELPFDSLPEEDRADEARLQRVLRSVKEDVRAPADFRASVMQAVAQEPTRMWARIAQWWLRPQPVRIRPAVGALALAASAAALMLLPGGTEPDRAPSETASVQVVTRFVLVAPEASSVRLTGDFSAWSPEGIALEDLRGTGIWTADVMLPPGIYQYTFVVNGTEWVPDPRAVSQVDDGFGQLNSVVIVPGGEA